MAPARVDVMTSIDAVGFNDAWDQRVETQLDEIDEIPISIISLRHLKENKRASNRDSDRLQLTRLEKYGKQPDFRR